MNYKSIILVSGFCLLIFGFGVNHASALTINVTTEPGSGDRTFDYVINAINPDDTPYQETISITTINGFGSQVVSFPVRPNSDYNVKEVVPDGWAIWLKVCDGSASYSNDSRGAYIWGIEINSNTTCTFSNGLSNSSTTGSIKIVNNSTQSRTFGSSFGTVLFISGGFADEKTFPQLEPTKPDLLSPPNYWVFQAWTYVNQVHLICDKGFMQYGNGLENIGAGFITVDAGETTTCIFEDGPMPLPLPSTLLPILSNEDGGGITQTSITWTWTTNHPTTSRVIYDTVSHDPLDPFPLGGPPNYGYANSTVEDPLLVTQHSVVISGLTPGTTYYFRTLSRGSPEAISKEFKAKTTSSDGQPENLNPVPTIKNISQASAIVDRKALTITINGTGFVPESIVEFDDDNLKTTYVSKTQLKAIIPSSEFFFAKIGKNNLAVTNPSPGGGTSNMVSFTIDNPRPTIKNISPKSVMAQGQDQIITINGTGFLPNSVGYINGVAKTDDQFWYVSKTLMRLHIPSTDILKVGSMSITVSNPNPGGGTTLAKKLTIKPFKNPIPKITSISQASIVAGSTIPLTLHVNGTNFVSGSKVKFGGVEKETVLIHGASGDYLEAVIPASDLAVVGGFNVRVFNPAPGGGTSLPKKFTVEKPKPYIDTTLSNTTTLNDIEIQLALIAAEVAKIVAESN